MSDQEKTPARRCETIAGKVNEKPVASQLDGVMSPWRRGIGLGYGNMSRALRLVASGFVLGLLSATAHAASDGDLRLQDGPSDSHGRLEVFHDGKWGGVCDNNFGDVEAIVACRQLGYTSGIMEVYFRPLPYEMPMWLDFSGGDVGCTGTESRLADCPHLGWWSEACHQNEAVSISCTGTAPDPDSAQPPDIPATPAVRALSTSSLRITWAAPASDSPITEYEYQHRWFRHIGGPDRHGEWVTGTTTATEVTLTSLTTLTHYEVQVRAKSANGTGGWSPRGSEWTHGIPYRPYEVQVTDSTASSLTVTWTPLSSHPATTDFDYRYRAQTNPRPDWTEVTTTDITGPPVEIGGLDANTSYEFQIRAVNSVGAGTWSSARAGSTDPLEPAPDSAQPPGIPATPAVRALSTSSLRITWAAPASDSPITEYEYQYRWFGSVDGYLYRSEWVTGTTTATEVTLTGLRTLTFHHVQVRAKSANGTGDWSPRGDGMTQGPPYTPFQARVIDSTVSSLIVTWAPVTSDPAVTDYDYRYRARTDPRPDWTEVTTTDITGPPLEIGGLDANTSYEMQVRAVNSVGTSTWSRARAGRTTAMARLSGTAPAAPPSPGEGCRVDVGVQFVGDDGTTPVEVASLAASDFTAENGRVGTPVAASDGLSWTVPAWSSAGFTGVLRVRLVETGRWRASEQAFRVTGGGSCAVAARNELASLALGDLALDPAYDAGTTAYTAEADADSEQTTVTASAVYGTASVSIAPADADEEADGHQLALAEGETEVTVTVTPGDGSAAKTYTVTVTREAADSPVPAPVNLRAVGGDEQVTLTWTAPEYGGSITGYEFRFCRVVSPTQCSYQEWNSTESATRHTVRYWYAELGGRTYRFRLPNGVKLRFQVRALAGDVEGVATAEVEATPTAPVAVAPRIEGTEVSSDWSLLPSGIGPGERFRLLMVTSTRRNAEASSISAYDSHARSALGGGHADIREFASQFRALACTGSVDARDHTGTTGSGVPVYWLGGGKVADGYADLYDGSWDSNAPRDEHGNAVGGGGTVKVFTGCASDGTGRAGLELGNGWRVAIGRATSGGKELNDPGTTTERRLLRPVYALSPVFVRAGAASAGALSVADARAEEGTDATLDFTVTLARSGTGAVTVNYATSDGSASAGEDYTATSGTLSFAAGEKSKTVSVPVLDDTLDEGEETLTLRLSNAQGATIADGVATGTIANDDPIPEAWLARFGRTVTGQMLDAVEGRLTASRTPGVHATLAGQGLALGSGAGTAGDWKHGGVAREGPAPSESLDGWRAQAGSGPHAAHGTDPDGTPRSEPRSLTGRGLAAGTSFALTGGTTENGFGALWGRGAVTSFDGKEGDLTLDGEVTTAMLGADWALRGRTAGLAVGHSRGTGGYRKRDCADNESCSGEVETSLTGLYPYAGLDLSEGVSVWASAGYGTGEVTLTPQGRTSISADLSMTMAAAGMRSALLAPSEESATSLAVTADGRFTQTSSDAVQRPTGRLEGSDADVWRLRLGVESSRTLRLGGDGGPMMKPSFEVGLRSDGGDAETGFGADIGGGFRLADTTRGLSLDLKARGLIAHEADGFRERGASASFAFDPRPSSDRGFSVSLRQSWGASSSGGMDALLGRETLAGLAAGDDGAGAEATSRLEAELGYGLPVFGGAFTGTPHAGVALTGTRREYRLGCRLTAAQRDALGFALDLEGTRSESTGADESPEHAVMLRGSMRW